VRAAAAGALGGVGDPAGKALASLVDATQDREPRVRRQAASSLGRIPYAKADADRALAALLVTVKDPDAGVRQATVAALGLVQVDPKEVVPSLLAALHDPDKEVLAAAAGTLTAKQLLPEAKTTVPALAEVLVEKGDVNHDVMHALEKMGPEGVRALAERLTD